MTSGFPRGEFGPLSQAEGSSEAVLAAHAIYRPCLAMLGKLLPSSLCPSPPRWCPELLVLVSVDTEKQVPEMTQETGAFKQQKMWQDYVNWRGFVNVCLIHKGKKSNPGSLAAAFLVYKGPQREFWCRGQTNLHCRTLLWDPTGSESKPWLICRQFNMRLSLVNKKREANF